MSSGGGDDGVASRRSRAAPVNKASLVVRRERARIFSRARVGAPKAIRLGNDAK